MHTSSNAGSHKLWRIRQAAHAHLEAVQRRCDSPTDCACHTCSRMVSQPQRTGSRLHCRSAPARPPEASSLRERWSSARQSLSQPALVQICSCTSKLRAVTSIAWWCAHRGRCLLKLLWLVKRAFTSRACAQKRGAWREHSFRNAHSCLSRACWLGLAPMACRLSGMQVITEWGQADSRGRVVMPEGVTAMAAMAVGL